MTPTTESAISKAIAAAADRDGQPVFYPREGIIFSSYEEAREFYNLYSWEVGFGIRDSRSKKNCNNYTTRRDIVCSCQVHPLAYFSWIKTIVNCVLRTNVDNI